LTQENIYLEVENIKSFDESPENEIQSNEPLFNCSNQYEENLRLNMNNSTENDNENYQEMGIDHKYEGSVILDSNDELPEAEFLDKVEIEPLQ